MLARVIEASTEQRADVDVDVASLRALHPGLKTLAAWLDGGGAALLPPGPR